MSTSYSPPNEYIIDEGMSRLFIESSGHDAGDIELSDDDGKEVKAAAGSPDGVQSADSDDRESVEGFASLPGTPRRDMAFHPSWLKEYGSEKEGRRKSSGDHCLDRAWEMKKCRASSSSEEEGMMANISSPSPRDQVVDGGDTNTSTRSECRLYVKPRRGTRSICMDMEEVKACKDLGLKLPCDWTVEIPGAGLSGPTLDTTSGANSPTANWRISSPGDDPKDVKARLKVWAQAVALASSASCSSD